jgi:membrane protease YdiL (CAAX protease family)
MYFLQAYHSKNKWWQYVVTLFAVAFTYLVLGSIPILIAFFIQSARMGPLAFGDFYNNSQQSFLGIDQNTGLILLLSPSVLTFFVLLIMLRLLHGKKIGEIASAAKRIRWKRLLAGAFFWLLLLGLLELFFACLNPGNYIFHYDPVHFLPLVLIALLLIPLQAWSEELLFRSYLMQAFGIWTGFRIIAILITSAGFAILHAANPEVSEFGFWATMPFYFGFGIVAGLLVVYDNGIEIACGVHAINNIYGAVLVSYNGSVLQTAALWKIKQLNPYAMNIGFYVIALIFLGTMAKLFNWSEPGKVFRKISGYKY